MARSNDYQIERKRRTLTYDIEMDRYLNGIIRKLSDSGIRNVSKADALKFLIMKDIETDCHFPCKIKRKPKTKKGFRLIWL